MIGCNHQFVYRYSYYATDATYGRIQVKVYQCTLCGYFKEVPVI